MSMYFWMHNETLTWVAHQFLSNDVNLHQLDCFYCFLTKDENDKKGKQFFVLIK